MKIPTKYILSGLCWYLLLISGGSLIAVPATWVISIPLFLLAAIFFTRLLYRSSLHIAGKQPLALGLLLLAGTVFYSSIETAHYLSELHLAKQPVPMEKVYLALGGSLAAAVVIPYALSIRTKWSLKALIAIGLTLLTSGLLTMLLVLLYDRLGMEVV